MVPQMVLINLPPGAPRLDPDLGTPADPLSYLLCSLEEGQAGDSSFPLSQQRGTEDNKARFTVDSVGAATSLLSLLSACIGSRTSVRAS